MAPINVVTLLCLVAVQTLVAPSSACYTNQMSTCSSWHLLSNVAFVDITVFQPTDNLEQLCRQVQDGLRCLTGPSVLGGCDKPGTSGNTYLHLYTSWQNAVLIPCSTARDAYLLGAECWDSQAEDVKAAIKHCHRTNRNTLKTDYCTGNRQLIECAQRDIAKVTGCSGRDSNLYVTMAATAYNTMAQPMNCDPMDIPSWTTTPVPTTTTTTITTTTTTSKTANTTVQAKPSTVDSSTLTSGAAKMTQGTVIGQASKSGGRRTGALFSLCVAALSVSVILQHSDV